MLCGLRTGYIAGRGATTSRGYFGVGRVMERARANLTGAAAGHMRVSRKINLPGAHGMYARTASVLIVGREISDFMRARHAGRGKTMRL